MINKIPWLHAAEVFDSWRVVPRFLIGILLWWTIVITDRTLGWYMHLPSAERTLEASGLAGVIVTGVTGLFTVVFKIYSSSGRDWTQQVSSMSTVSTQTVTPASAAGQG